MTHTFAPVGSPVTTTIELTHTRVSKEEWGRSDAHCPSCGTKGRVCCMLGLPLAFDAAPHACLSCGAQFALSMARAERMQDGDIERLKLLRQAFPAEGASVTAMRAASRCQR